MYVGGVPSTPPYQPNPAAGAVGEAEAFQATMEQLAEQAAEDGADVVRRQHDPYAIDLETVARYEVGVTDEETEEERKARENGETVDSSSSAAPSAMVQFLLAQEWLITNNSVSQQILQSLQSSGADTTEAAAPGAARVGGMVPATAVPATGEPTAATATPHAPKGVTFI